MAVRLTGFRDWDWEAEGFWSGLPSEGLSPLGTDANVIRRPGNTATLGPGSVGERVIPAEFGYAATGYGSWSEARSYLLWRLRPTDTTPGELRGKRADGTAVAMQAVLTMPPSESGGDVNTLIVRFVSVDPVWTATAPVSTAKGFTDSKDLALSAPLTGQERPATAVTVKPTVQRAAGTADAGWTWRRIYRLTNLSSQTLVDYPFGMELGLTNGLVTAGKALASGNDLRIVSQGVEWPRLLVDWNNATIQTIAWVVVPNLPPGASIDLEVWYGNAAAGAPPLLTGANKPVVDVDTAGANRSGNFEWRYNVTQDAAGAGKGGWYLDAATDEPELRLFDVPGAWRPARTVPNTDAVIQSSYVGYTITGTDYYKGIFAARRSRAGAILPGVDGTSFDGVVLSNPLGITSVTFDLYVLNERTSSNDATPLGRVVLATRKGGAGAWKPRWQQTALAETVTTIAQRTETFAAPVRQVAFAVWPRAGVRRISDAAGGDREVYGQWRTVLRVGIDSGKLSYNLIQAEEAIYELATELRLGGRDQTAPYTAVRIGRWANPGARYAVRLNEVVVLDLETRRAERWNATRTTLIERVPAAAVRAVDGVLVNGATVERAAVAWLPMRPAYPLVINPSFTTDATGWTRGVSGVTADPLTRDTAIYATAPASGRVTVTAAPAAGYVTERLPTLALAGRSVVRVGASVRTANANIEPRLWIAFYDAAAAFISESFDSGWTPAANTWYRRVHQAVPPTNARTFLVGILFNVPSGQIGSAYFDDFTLDGNEVAVTETALGGEIVGVEWVPVYAG